MHVIEPSVPGWMVDPIESVSEPLVSVDRSDDAGQANLHLVLSLAAIALAGILSLW